MKYFRNAIRMKQFWNMNRNQKYFQKVKQSVAFSTKKF